MNLILFTNGFPFIGMEYEYFLEVEIEYLSAQFENIFIIPQKTSKRIYPNLPSNVQVIESIEDSGLRVRQVIIKYGLILLKYFVYELIYSPHRLKYILHFNWNFNRLLGLVKGAHNLKRTLYNYQTEVIYSYWFNDWVSKLLLINEMGGNLAIITRIHLFDFEEEFHERGYIPFRYKEIKGVRKVISVSNYGKKYVENRYKIPDKCILSRLGVKKGKINSGTRSGPFVVVSCSGLVWYKRPLLLLETMQNIKIDVNWWHFGGGHLESEFLERATCLPKNVKLIYNGQVDNSEVLEFYKNNEVDLLLNMSSYEGIPVAMMEAISYGIPIAGCNVCGVPEIINDKTGILFERNPNPQVSAKYIEAYLHKMRNITDDEKNALRYDIQKDWNLKYNASDNYDKFIIDVLKKVDGCFFQTS